jgi:phage terminase large subunit
MSGQPIPILLFADSILGVHPYDWQCQVLLNYESGRPTAAACANFTGKTSTVFPICALWTLYNFPRSRVMYLSATGQQVRNQFMASLERFRSRPALAGYQWLETEVRTPSGAFLFGRSSDVAGNIEGIHDQFESPAGLLVDEAKSIRPEVLDALDRCHTTFRLFMSSTGAAFGTFYEVMTSKAHLWRTFRVKSSDCPHVDPALIEADRQNLKASVFAIKHDCQFLYDAGDSMISLEHVRALIDNPPAFVPGPTTAFCDFAGSGDESVFALCEGNRVTIEPEWCWRSRDTMHSVGKFLTLFRKLNLQGWQLGGDSGYGHQLMDRMAEQDYHLQRFNNGSPAKQPDIFFNLSAEQWSEVGQAIERRQLIIPNDEKLIAQLTSRRKLYDSRGRERLESKADLKARGVESPDRADALMGAIAMRLAQDPFAFDVAGRQSMNAAMQQTLRQLERQRPHFAAEYVDWNRVW